MKELLLKGENLQKRVPDQDKREQLRLKHKQLNSKYNTVKVTDDKLIHILQSPAQCPTPARVCRTCVCWGTGRRWPSLPSGTSTGGSRMTCWPGWTTSSAAWTSCPTPPRHRGSRWHKCENRHTPTFCHTLRNLCFYLTFCPMCHWTFVLYTCIFPFNSFDRQENFLPVGTEVVGLEDNWSIVPSIYDHKMIFETAAL